MCQTNNDVCMFQVTYKISCSFTCCRVNINTESFTSGDDAERNRESAINENKSNFRLLYSVSNSRIHVFFVRNYEFGQVLKVS